MKKLLITLLCCFNLTILFSQIYVNKNNVVKLEALGWNKTYYSTRVTNKASCPTTIKIAYSGWSVDTLMSANEVAIIRIPDMPSTVTQIKAKRIAGASCLTGVSNEWVEVNVVQTILPVNFKSISAQRINNTSARLEFETEETENVQSYTIKISLDGSTWKNVLVLFPDGVYGSKKYSVIINF